MIFDHLGEKVELLAHRALHFPQRQVLVIADLHFGKVNHFRKSGIPVPEKANDSNTTRLIECLQSTHAKQVIFLGDLFHSHYNFEWEVIGQIRNHFPATDFLLIEGNHDILSDQQYARHQIQVVDQLQFGPYLFTHEPLEHLEDLNHYNIAGHIHPGVRLLGTARQSMMLPCFYFGKHQALLPAFGSFTGLARIQAKKDDRIFVIAESKIVEMSHA